MAYHEDQQALMANLLRGQQAKQELAGVNEKYKAAQQMRDAPMQGANQYGTASGLQIIADMVGKSQGRRQVRQLTPQREQLQQEQAQIAGEAQQSALARTLGMQQQKEEAETAATELTASKYQDTLDKQTRKEAFDKKKFDANEVYRNKTLIAKAEKAAKPKPNRRNNMTSKQAVEFTEAATGFSQYNRVVDGWKDWYSQPTGAPTSFLNNAASFVSRQGLGEYIPGMEDMDARVKESDAAWADVRKLYELAQRHDMFGATLSKAEGKSWDSAFAALKGMSGPQVSARLRKLRDDMQEVLRNNLNTNVRLSANNPEMMQVLGDIGDRSGFVAGEDGLYSVAPKGAPAGQGDDVFIQSLSPEIQKQVSGYSGKDRARVIELLRAKAAREAGG